MGCWAGAVRLWQRDCESLEEVGNSGRVGEGTSTQITSPRVAKLKKTWRPAQNAEEACTGVPGLGRAQSPPRSLPSLGTLRDQAKSSLSTQVSL